MVVGTRVITLVAMLATAVTCTPFNFNFNKRQMNGSTVVFRSDLKGVQDGQSDRFKNLILTTVTGSDGTPEISFIDTCQVDLASGGIVQPQNLPLTTNTTGTVTTAFMNVALAGDPSTPQPVVLSTSEQQGLGSIFEDGGEVKLKDTEPRFDTWLICNGESHPEMAWLGIVDNKVRIPGTCSAIRLFRMKLEELQRSVEGRC
ncbi:MAG: hypothetical protein Q9216_005265 [Gyalolechia sp. 2 TL-2023]